MGHFIDIFGARTQRYIEQLMGKTRPRRVVVCMLYYLDEDSTSGSWADFALSSLGYNRDPTLLQLMIRSMFEHATRHISIEGTEVVPLPLFQALNGKDTRDYSQRVEPSPQGGKKLARHIIDAVIGSGGM